MCGSGGERVYAPPKVRSLMWRYTFALRRLHRGLGGVRVCSSASSSSTPRSASSLSIRAASSTPSPPPPAAKPNLLVRFMRDKIRTSGPITVHEFMSLATSSAAGYYAQRPKEIATLIGAEGDFVTSPELSQAFGELLGVWVYNELAHCGRGAGVWQLVELGAGSGRLIADVLRTLHTLNEVRADGVVRESDLSVHLIEASDALVDTQRATLRVYDADDLEATAALANADGEAPAARRTQRPRSRSHTRRAGRTAAGVPIYWHRSVETVPEQFSVFLANEFLDALPIHQFRRRDNEWLEVCVSLDKSGERFNFVSIERENVRSRVLIPEDVRKDESRTQWEVCPQACALVTQIAERITRAGGFGLFVDYGHDGSRLTPSLRAYRAHTQVDPLDEPGAADITADVDFGHLRRLLDGVCLAFGPMPQRVFLAQMGIRLRIERLLAATADLEARRALLRAYTMLIDNTAGGMGARFHAFALFPRTLERVLTARGGCPAGFFPVGEDDEEEDATIGGDESPQIS